jgi:hypothetical protein
MASQDHVDEQQGTPADSSPPKRRTRIVDTTEQNLGKGYIIVGGLPPPKKPPKKASDLPEKPSGI